MKAHLTGRFVRNVEPEPGRNITIADDEVTGFGLHMTQAGAKAFVLRYRIAGRERRMTIGAWPDWSVSAARDQAKVWKRRIDQGSAQ